MARAWPPRTSVDALLALAIGVLALLLYVATLQPDIGGPEDTPKFQFVGYVLGTAHPPGYPLYVLLSHPFVRFVPIGSIAYRANLFSAVMAATACALAYLICVGIGCRRGPAMCATAGLATGSAFWYSAVFAEVYSLAAVMTSLAVWLLLQWTARGRRRYLLAAVAAVSLGLGNHLTILGLIPAFVIYVLITDRHVLTLRLTLAATAILLACLAQYGFVILRTHQGAVYLESTATSLNDLLAIVTAERFATERFAFSLSELITVQAPAVASVVVGDLGMGGTLFLVVGVFAAARRRNRRVALVGGAAAGIFGMVINLRGDISGFITSMLPLVWPIGAFGIDALLRLFQTRRLIVGTEAVSAFTNSLRAVRINLGWLVLLGAAAIPLLNLGANYREADQSDSVGTARFFRAVYAELPARAAFVGENYFVDMVLHYLIHTPEGGPGKDIIKVTFAPYGVRNAAAEGRRVFALEESATWFAAEGLQFEPADFGRPISVWTRELPPETVLVGAVAAAPVPFELFGSAARNMPLGQPRAATVFAHVVGRPTVVQHKDDAASTLIVDEHLLGLPGFAPAGKLVATADTDGARIVVGGRTIAEVPSGTAVAMFTPEGTLARAFELEAGKPLRVPLEPHVYEYAGENPCVQVTDRWTDLGPLGLTASWVTTLDTFGAVHIETELHEPNGNALRARELTGTGAAQIISSRSTSDSTQTFVAELVRSTRWRPVFKLALERAAPSARARILPGGARSSLNLCADVPGPLIAEPGDWGVVTADDSHAYFGPNWSGQERTLLGPVRRAEDRATLWLPLEATGDYSLTLEVFASPAARVAISANGTAIGVCPFRQSGSCELKLPKSTVRDGVNALTMVVEGGRLPDEPGVTLTFHRATVRRTLQ